MGKLNSSGRISLAGSTTGESVSLALNRSATTQTALGESAVSSGLAGINLGSTIGMANLYGKFAAFSAVAYGIGGGGGSRYDTTGASGGGGAVVKNLYFSNSGLTYVNIYIGNGGVGGYGYAGNGGTSYLVGPGVAIYAYGGAGGYYGPNCGTYCSGPAAGGGGASGGDLNLAGGNGSGWNNYFYAEYPCCDQYGNCSLCCCLNYEGPGGDGQCGVLNGVTYCAAGGGTGGHDGYSYEGGRGGYGGNLGGSGGTTPGCCGYGGPGGYYGGGSGGAGNYGRQCGAGAPGVFQIRYTSPNQLASGGSITYSGGVWTHLFTSSGTFSPI